VGVILDVEPIVSEDNSIIELSIAPEIVLFEGFIDYGSPVTIATGGIGNQRVLAAQPYVQPVFRTNRLNTAISIYDGATVVLGGVVSQNVRGVHDRVPIFGDVPLAGRLFQSKVDQNNTLNVVFFVQVRVIDPGGRPVNR
jgi:general secretion pathway protein D